MGARNRTNGANAFALTRTLDAVAAVQDLDEQLAALERQIVAHVGSVRRLKALLKDTCGRLDSDTAPWRDVSGDELAAYGEPVSLERARARRRTN